MKQPHQPLILTNLKEVDQEKRRVWFTYHNRYDYLFGQITQIAEKEEIALSQMLCEGLALWHEFYTSYGVNIHNELNFPSKRKNRFFDKIGYKKKRISQIS